MGDITANFSKHEFACHCGCGYDDINTDLVALLQKIRDHYGQPIQVMSGCRCRSHNAACGGARSSQHLLGNAADIKVAGIPPKTLHDDLEKRFGQRIGGMGLYKTFVHVDVRRNRARWHG